MSSTTPGSEPLDGDAVPEPETTDVPPTPTAPDDTADVAIDESADVATDAPAPGDDEVVSSVESSEVAPPSPAAAAPAEAAPAAEAPAPEQPAEDAAPAAALEEPAPADPADTSALDAAVLRANAGHEASEPELQAAAAAAADAEPDGVDDADTAVPPVAAGSVRRETYVPPSTAATAGAVGAATLAPEPAEAYAPPAQTVYVQAPNPPRPKGNRAFGVLVALIGTALFALLYAGIAYLLLLSQASADAVNEVYVERFLTKPVYSVPIVAFFVGFAVLAAIVNRGRWWAYVVFGVLVGALVYFSYIAGALLTVEAWTLTFDQATSFISQRWLDPFAIVAAVVAREIPIWLGGWIAARGRVVTERNREALEAYDRELAAGPQARG
ncbi:hypothetical protein MUN74_13220 [Agromyces endophyticus]|uniref:hypothetical protein n=1 Tax=Agromyces sp. H17E-10 TaxID=2932244 RepID=UPI001FD09C5B|nr:hypothetical protein [Agromyces sp. H17E-10]UOQ88241.1 hypothetical protein MUN74_13220 [Agromyces sp. H17E-10]